MARIQTTTQQHLAVIRPRTFFVCCFVGLLYFLLAGRLVYLQAARHMYFQKEAEASRVSHSILPARRGLILDRNGEVLAINVPAAAVYADPVEVENPAMAADSLAPLLGEDPARLRLLLTPGIHKRRYVSLKRHLPLAAGDSVRALNLRGISVGPDQRRSYPNGRLASQILGFTDRDGVGLEGIERSQDRQLQGVDGKIVGEVDQRDRFIPGTIRHDQEAVSGSDLVLTIDKTLQHTADVELAAAVKAHHAHHGVVVVLDPRTGEILALSNSPGYDPNAPRANRPKLPVSVEPNIVLKPGQKKPVAVRPKKPVVTPAADPWRNAAVSDLYEPGSTMKTITTAAVIQEEGMKVLDRHVYCGGTYMISGKPIHCAKDPPHYGVHGDETLRGILRDSCNIGMAQFGMGLGASRLYDSIWKFGLLDSPHCGLPGEQKSLLRSPTEYNHFIGRVGWSNMQLANISFGQGISVTPLQLASAYAAIANGGMLMRPHIIRAVARGDVQTPVAPEAIRRVLDPKVAAMVRSLLGTVVQEGTGKPAQIAGFSVGGKTGSAQVAGRHSYEPGHYVASFIGMVPLSAPRLVILCSVFEPVGVHWGAAVAAPVVHNIAKQAMLQMHISPDSPEVVDWDDHLKSKKRAASADITHLTIMGAGPRSIDEIDPVPVIKPRTIHEDQ